MRRVAFRLRSSWLLLAVFAALSGCSAVVSPDVEKLGPRPAACEPGTLNPFTCPDSAIVNQKCNDQGAYIPAVCPPTSCEPTTTWPCRCSDGTAATRTCQPNSTWESCPCASAHVAGASGG